MWYKNSNGNNVKPNEINQVSSRIYVYVRKDFKLIPESGEGEDIVPEHWEWMETKIRKEDWGLFVKVAGHDDALDDVYAALTELAGIIAGEE